MGMMRGGEKAEEGAGREVGVAFCLYVVWVRCFLKNGRFWKMYTVSIMPFPTREC